MKILSTDRAPEITPEPSKSNTVLIVAIVLIVVLVIVGVLIYVNRKKTITNGQ